MQQYLLVGLASWAVTGFASHSTPLHSAVSQLDDVSQSYHSQNNKPKTYNDKMFQTAVDLTSNVPVKETFHPLRNRRHSDIDKGDKVRRSSHVKSLLSPDRLGSSKNRRDFDSFSDNIYKDLKNKADELWNRTLNKSDRFRRRRSVPLSDFPNFREATDQHADIFKQNKTNTMNDKSRNESGVKTVVKDDLSNQTNNTNGLDKSGQESKYHIRPQDIEKEDTKNDGGGFYRVEGNRRRLGGKPLQPVNNEGNTRNAGTNNRRNNENGKTFVKSRLGDNILKDKGRSDEDNVRGVMARENRHRNREREEGMGGPGGGEENRRREENGRGGSRSPQGRNVDDDHQRDN